MSHGEAPNMNAPTARPESGVIIYARDFRKLSRFYIELFGMTVLRETEDFISIGSSAFNIVLHVPPIALPVPRFNAVKLFLTVESHEQARKKAIQLGGMALAGEWSNPIFKVCNIADPEGNQIQIREFMSK
jgi:predicted enzyme related to lactoylglutathione lyase